MAQLSKDEINNKLKQLHGWKHEGDHIEKEFTFDDFGAALAAMVQMGIEADKMNHHPDWSNVYNRLHVKLTTHDAGGLTEKDFKLAAAMDKIAG